MILSCSKEKQEQPKSVKPKQENVVVDKEFELFKKYRYFDYDRVTEAKYKVLKTGDKFAYGELELFYSYNESKKFEILPYSIIMVEKHKKYDKCSVVFFNILESFADIDPQNSFNGTDESLVRYLKNIERLSVEQRNFAISYLKLGAKNDDYGSVKFLEIMYRNGFGVPKDLKMADSLKKLKNEIDLKLGLHLSIKKN